MNKKLSPARFVKLFTYAIFSIGFGAIAIATQQITLGVVTAFFIGIMAYDVLRPKVELDQQALMQEHQYKGWALVIVSPVFFFFTIVAGAFFLQIPAAIMFVIGIEQLRKARELKKTITR